LPPGSIRHAKGAAPSQSTNVSSAGDSGGGTGRVSFTSTIDIDGITRMKPRKSRKKNPKLPMVSVLSTSAGTKIPQVYGEKSCPSEGTMMLNRSSHIPTSTTTETRKSGTGRRRAGRGRGRAARGSCRRIA
jgi:hypothetical protein